MNGAANATKDASPTPTKARAVSKRPKLGAMPHATTEADHTAIPMPSSRNALGAHTHGAGKLHGGHGPEADVSKSSEPQGVNKGVLLTLCKAHKLPK